MVKVCVRWASSSKSIPTPHPGVASPSMCTKHAEEHTLSYCSLIALLNPVKLHFLIQRLRLKSLLGKTKEEIVITNVLASNNAGLILAEFTNHCAFYSVSSITVTLVIMKGVRIGHLKVDYFGIILH